MDPLGRPGWKGEWISVAALRRFAWTTRGGALSVAVTPTAKAAPYAKVTIAKPTISTTSRTLTADFGLRTPRKWAFPGADVKAAFTRADDPLLAAALSMPVGRVPAAKAAAPKKPIAGFRGKTLRVTAGLPAKAGAYRATLTLTDRRFGRLVARIGNVAVFVPGPRRATLTLFVRDETIEGGKPADVSVYVVNTGTETWAERGPGVSPQAEPSAIRGTHVVARWIRLGVPADAPAPPPVSLGAVPLAPGGVATIRTKLLAPASPGAWALVVDVVDDVDGSFASLGSAPAVRAVEVAVSPHNAVVE